MLSAERWQTFSQRDQLGHIAAEVLRAHNAAARDQAAYRAIVERALTLVDLTLDDPKWRQGSLPLFVLRNELSCAYIGQPIDLGALSAAL